MKLDQNPGATTKFVVLRGLEKGNRFFSNYLANEDQTRLTSGEVAYEVLGYCDTVEDAQLYLFGRVMPRG